MAGDTILVIDAGTTSTRAMLFSPDGALLGSRQAELTQHYPRPGWVEHDAGEIWEKSVACARAVAEEAGGAERIAGDRDHQSARDDLLLVEADGEAAGAGDRLAGPAYGRRLRAAEGGRA